MKSVEIIINPDLKNDDRVALKYYKRLERLFMYLDKYANYMNDKTLVPYKSEIGRRQRELQKHGYTVPFTVSEAQKYILHFGGEPDLMVL